MTYQNDTTLADADVTKSRYRYMDFTGGSYRRFLQTKTGDGLNYYKKPAVEMNIKAHGSYGSLLFDPKWKERRLNILIRDKHACVICHSASHLQVHHRQYHFILRDQQFKLPWDYADKLLITLCRACHQKGHYQYQVPTIHL